MTFASRFLHGVWDFVVGDDWQTSLGVLGALAVTALIATSDLAAWWVMPCATVALLRWSLLRRVRAQARRAR